MVAWNPQKQVMIPALSYCAYKLSSLKIHPGICPETAVPIDLLFK